MKRLAKFGTALALLVAVGQVSWSAEEKGQPGDLKQLAQLLNTQVDARNQGKSEMLLDVFAPDADLRTVDGLTIRGRNKVIEHQTPRIQDSSRGTLKVSSVVTRFLRDDVVLRQTHWEINSKDGKESVPGRTLTLIVKRDGRWMVLCLRSMVPLTEEAKAPAELPTVAPPTEDKALDQARKRASAYVEDYNARRIDAIVKYWAADGEIIGHRGNGLKGVLAIRKVYTEAFAANDKLRIEGLAVQSARLVGDDLLIYDGAYEVKGRAESHPGKVLFTTVAQKDPGGAWGSVCNQTMVPYAAPEAGRKP